MKCKICGAELKKEGDICSKCYKEIYIVFILVIIGFLATRNFLNAFFTFFILALVIAVLLFFFKRLALSTKAIFYETKVLYLFNFLFIKKEKIVKYDEISDISIFQTHRQKRFGLGDICIYAKGFIPGASYFSGFQIKNVEDVENTVKKIKEIIGKDF